MSVRNYVPKPKTEAEALGHTAAVFSWKNPDYTQVLNDRANRLIRLRKNPDMFPGVCGYYHDNPAQFISDWGMTFDPRNPERGLPAHVPFILFPRQVEWVNWVVDHWKNQRPGLTEKTRDMGMSWLSVSLACTLCIFNEGITIGFGSRKEDDVDHNGDPDSLFEKARLFMGELPDEFRAGWSPSGSPHMRIDFPNSRSNMIGKSGDGIGRGGRAALYMIDESAFLERPDLVDRSLSATTNCRMDISTPNGTNNSFARKRFSYPSENIFTFHWRDDPRKDQEWYDKQVREKDPVTVAQEINIDYSASVDGVLIPNSWVQAAIDSHLKLGIANGGSRMGSLDIADLGKDKCAFAMAYGFLIEAVHEWTGKESDILATVHKAFDLCDEYEYDSFRYDADGMGVDVRGDARMINELRKARGQSQLDVIPFNAGGAIINPDKDEYAKGRKNRDVFVNFKAQSWWHLRTKFQKTYRAIVDGESITDEDLISISSKLPNLGNLIQELSQPTYSQNGIGKTVINKCPPDCKSPNLADAVMMRFAPMKVGLSKAMRLDNSVIGRFRRPISNEVFSRFR